jgi:hypothetical protein
MSKHYPTEYRSHANLFEEEELVVPDWVWLLAVVLIALVLIVR